MTQKWNKTNDLVQLEPMTTKGKHIKYTLDDVKVASVQYKDTRAGTTYVDFGKDGCRVYQRVLGAASNYVNCTNIENNFIISGLCLSGGSTLGLEATTGVIAEKFKQNEYYSASEISGAVVYGGLRTNKEMYYPDKRLGRFAVNHLVDNKVYVGQVGAGIGSSYGQGSAFGEIYGVKFLAIVINNIYGDVIKNNSIVEKKHNYSSWSNKKKDQDKQFASTKENISTNQNSCLIAVITDLDLDITQLRLMSNQLQSSVGQVIYPFNTIFDGDIIYTCSTMKLKKKFNPTQTTILFERASSILKKAIFKSAKY